MAQDSGIVSLLKENISQTNVKLYTPDADDYETIDGCFVWRPVKTLAVARPQTDKDVATLLRFCIDNNVEFTVRSGGHDCAGRTRAEGALVIDMRDINHVEVSEDKKTARVGGGILFGELEKKLSEQDLLTPCGSMPGVGYVGWSTLGGYGSMTARYGLGVDQICGAKVVNAKGEIQDASDDMLVGIRGGGGTLGIIVEVTIKVYPLHKLLQSTIVFESGDLASAMTSYADYYEQLISTEELPATLQLQPMTIELPNLGMAFAVVAIWSSPDHDEGRRWTDKISSAAPCAMVSSQDVSLLEFLDANDKLVIWPSYGRTATVSLKRWTRKTMEVLAKYSASAPGGGLATSTHSLRSPRASEVSVFGSRVDHHMLEIMALTGEKELQGEREAWAVRLQEELRREDPGNVLEGTYVSLGTDADTDLEKVYGGCYSRLLELKNKYDGGNVFKYAVPRLISVESKE